MKQEAQILVVDNEPGVRRRVQQLLEHDGHEVWVVASGDVAVAQLMENKFDLVITGYFKSHTKEDQVATRIRKQFPSQRIVMAATAADESKLGKVSKSADVLLQKPFSAASLRTAVHQALSLNHGVVEKRS